MRAARNPLSMALAGTLVCCVLGAGLVALTTDTVTSPGNKMVSGLYTPPEEPPPPQGAHNLELAIGTQDDIFDCGDSPYSTDVTSAMSSITFDMNAPLNHDGENYCVRNAGSGPVALSFRLANIVETEPKCTGPEAEAEAGTCAPVGELAQFVDVGAWPFNAPSSQYCKGEAALAAGPMLEIVDDRVIAVLPAGGVCVLFFRFSFVGDDAAKVIAQSDTVRFDVVFTGSDPALPPPTDHASSVNS